MGTLLFVVALAAFGVVLGWYCLNEAMGADGEKGLLALRSDRETLSSDVEGGRHYRMRRRAADIRPKLTAQAPGEESWRRSDGDPDAFREKSGVAFRPSRRAAPPPTKPS